MAKKAKNNKKKSENAEAVGGEAAVVAKPAKVKKVRKKKEVDPIIFPIIIVVAIIGMLLAKIVYETWMFSKETNHNNKNSAATVVDASYIGSSDGENYDAETVSFAYLNLDGENYEVI
ncbi:MAG: hypothetical protein LBL93_03335 [Ruminococcus sp.]|jgi:hypothetical protein|nr:hypothetical protein [Ruminococcus sp.]